MRMHGARGTIDRLETWIQLSMDIVEGYVINLDART
jgi:hypothetical protein